MTNKIPMSQLQAKILSFLFEKTELVDPVDDLEFSLAGSFKGKFRCAYGELGSDEEKACLVFNLPTYSTGVFLCINRVHHREASLLLANIEDYERESGQSLRAGEVVVIPKDGGVTNFIGCTPYSLLLLSPQVSPELSGIPYHYDFNGTEISFFLVFPLTEEDHSFLHSNGHDALMDKLSEEGRDLFLN